jgi:hypothetical protein
MDLFRTSTRYYYGEETVPILMPKPMASLGISLRYLVGKILGREPFERPWMIKYINKKLNVDASFTHKALSWTPTARYHILRRLLFLVEKMKRYPDEWYLRNETLLRRIARRPNILVYRIMVESREALVDQALEYVITPKRFKRFGQYQKMDTNLLKWYINLFYMVIAATVRNRDRFLMRNYAEIIGSRRFAEGFRAREVTDFILVIANIVTTELVSKPELKGMEQQVYDYISLTTQLAADEIEDSYELFAAQSPEARPKAEDLPSPADSDDLRRMIRQLEDICIDSPDICLRSEEAGVLEGGIKAP